MSLLNPAPAHRSVCTEDRLERRLKGSSRSKSPLKGGNSEVEALRKEVESLKDGSCRNQRQRTRRSGSSGPGATATPQIRPKLHAHDP